MATLSPRARRRHDDIELMVHERNARHVVELVDSWGLPRDRRSVKGEDVASWIDSFDHAEVRRTVADVWSSR